MQSFIGTMKWSFAVATCLGLLGSCTSVPPCEEREEPYLLLTATAGFGDPPISVVGRACGGAAFDPTMLASDYEVIVYAHTNKWYVQPFEASFREPINENGYFMTRSHEGDRVHAFVAQRGMAWDPVLDLLPSVDGVFIIAEAEAEVAGFVLW